MTLNRISSQLNLERLEKAFPSKAAFKAFKANMDDEAAAFETYRLISQGSKTGMVQAAQRNLGKQSVDHIGHDTVGIVANGLDRLLNGGLSVQAKEELGQLILTPLKDLPPDVIASLSRRVAAKVGSANKTQVSKLLGDLSQGSYAASTGAVTAPAITGLE